MDQKRDLTEVFRKLVTEKRQINGKVHALAPFSSSSSPTSPKSNGANSLGILSRPLKRSAFLQSCLQTQTLLTQLEEFLSKNRLAYLQGNKVAVGGKGAAMTEHERQKIDNEADQCLKQCDSTIAQLQNKLTQMSGGRLSAEARQLIDHHSRILLYLLDLYARVSTTYFKQKSDRLANSLEERQGYTHHFAELLAERNRPRFSSDGSFSSPSPIDHDDRWSEEPEIQRGSFEQDSREADGHRGAVSDDFGHLDAQMQEQLRRENLVLQSSLSSMSDDIRQVEQQIVVISQAQQLIANNLMQQRDDLEQIHKHTKDATVHISKGNTELEKAAQSSSKFRIIVLIILLSMSFTLLLLHRIED